MIKHVALFRIKEGTPPEAVQAFSDALTDMVPKIDVIRTYEHGPDLGAAEGTYDYAVIAGFDSVEDYHTYSGHPVHVHVVETYAKPIVGGSVRVQLEA